LKTSGLGYGSFCFWFSRWRRPAIASGSNRKSASNDKRNVRIEYDLSTGRANFYWQNSLKISGFYAGVGLDTYVTGTIYTNRTWMVTNNQVIVTSTRGDLPTMKQTFILDQDSSFLTRLDVAGSGLQSRWMSPLVMDVTGGVILEVTMMSVH